MLYNVPAISGGTLDELVSAIADSYLKPCTCPCFSPNTNRINKILSLSEVFQVDGVIYQSFSGCSLYEMEQKSVLAALQDKNIPMLFVETDYNPEDSGQLSTRVEAFLESIQIRKKRSGGLK